MGLGGAEVSAKDADIDAVVIGESTNEGALPDGKKNQPDVETGPALCGCGFPPDPPEDLTTPWPVQEKWCFIIPAVLGFVAIVGSIVHAAAPDEVPYMAPPYTLKEVIGRIFIGTLVFNLIWAFLGMFVVHCGAPVAITRKIMHVLLQGVAPLVFVDIVYANDDTPLAEKMWRSAVWDCLLASISNFFWMKPVRRLPYIGALSRTAFAAVDRPEDRPHTLVWVTVQLCGLPLMTIPMMYWLIENNVGSLRFICPLAVGLGDGLAEPIGKRFGKHKYQVYALFTKERFTRSYEGSANVFFWTLLGVLIAIPELSIAQVIFLTILLPPAMTLTEAKSPHTMDNIFMFGCAWLFTAVALEIRI
jgi:phytol kinase